MNITLRAAQTLSMLLPEEIAMCFVMLKLCFPATFLAGEPDGLIEYIGRRWLVDAIRQ